MKTRAIWLLLALLSFSCGDGKEVACAAYAVFGLSVSVANMATGEPICDATVTATEEAYSEQLIAGACSFWGATERPGTYVIRAARQGFLPNELASVLVVMGGGGCPHVEQTRVTIQLTPEG